MQGACAFVDLGGGKVASNLQELVRFLDGTKEGETAEIHDFDIVHPSSPGLEAEDAPLTAILYGSVGTASFWELHQVLAARAGNNDQSGRGHQPGGPLVTPPPPPGGKTH